MDPGSAAHHHSASKTRVYALMVLRSVRGTPLLRAGTAEDRVLRYSSVQVTV
jgi:hypothetical protein